MAEKRITTPLPDKAAAEPVELHNGAARTHGTERELEHFEHVRMRYADLYEFSPVAYVSLAPDGRIDEINLAGGRILGENPHRLAGRNFADFIVPNDIPAFRKHLALSRDATSQASVQLRLHPVEGAPLDVELLTIATQDADRRLLQFRTAILNITARKAAEEALRQTGLELERRVEERTREVTQSHRLLVAVIDKASDVIFAKDLDGRYRLINAAGARFIGRAVDDILGKRDEDLYPPETAAGIVENDRTVLESRTTVTFESLVKSHVAERWFQTTTGLYTDDDGQILGIAGIARDITDRRKREETHRFLSEAGVILAASLDYETTVASLARLAVPFLADGCIVDVVRDGSLRRVAVAHRNPQQEHLMWSLEPFIDTEGVIGRAKVLRTGRTEMYSQITPEFEAALARTPEHLRIIRQLAFRSYMCVPLRMRGAAIGTVGFLREGHAPPYAAADLELAEELADRASLALENAVLYSNAQEANRLKDDFLARVSHELRTPLTPILGAIYMARLREWGFMDPDGPLDIIERNARRQVEIVEDLLDISRIASGTLELHKRDTNIFDIVERAAGRVRQSAETLAIRLEVALGGARPVVECDPERMEQVLLNLLSNALKFTPPGGRIEVRAEAEGNRVRISVRDTGIGIPSDFLPRLFERFSQAGDFATRTHAGLGLGLSIARHIVERHSGTIHAESAGEGQGATFTIDLPTVSKEA